MKWNAWSVFMLVVLLVVFVLAWVMPVRADSQVFGLSIEITATAPGYRTTQYLIDVRGRGRTEVRDSQHCGAPTIGPAYAQYVQLDDGTEYRTLYAGCAYEMLP